MPQDKVVELSIDETNNLRATLGLKPLRVSSTFIPTTAGDTSKTDELTLSVQDSNALRSKLGLPPLNISKDAPSELSGKKASEAIHAPASNTRDRDLVKARIEDAKMKREVEAGVAKMKKETSSIYEHAEINGDTTDWIQKMRESKSEGKPEKKKEALLRNNDDFQKYTNNSFKDQNLTVTHNAKDFDVGQTTILTLADQMILDEEGDNENMLENVNMTENTVAAKNMEPGRSGGYDGYDDNEFGEAENDQIQLGINRVNKDSKSKGFKLGQKISNSEEDKESDIFALGKSVSLVSSKKSSMQADFMTYEEEESMGAIFMNKKDIEKRRRKKEKKLLKKMKKEGIEMKKPILRDVTEIGKDIVDELESTKHKKVGMRRKRKRYIDSDDSDNDDGSIGRGGNEHQNGNDIQENKDASIQQDRKNKFNIVMEKGNQRTQRVFENNPRKQETRDSETSNDIQHDHDDAFLSSSLSKARRLNRLKNLGKRVNDGTSINSKDVKGADAVVKSISSMKAQVQNETLITKNKNPTQRITFELDATKQFTAALRSKEAEKKRLVISKKVNTPLHNEGSKSQILHNQDAILPAEKNDSTLVKKDKVDNLDELAHEVKLDDNVQFGDTAATKPVGRGLSSFLSMLKHTGDITGKHAGKEELRGRAKDERNYEDYEKLNLQEVVQLDNRAILNDKDFELANREIKLEYRDDHGRLLTRKEAYRQLCYQFHGHGSSKKNEERRLKQIERERTQGSIASKHGKSGTLGALKATQKATGKAFVPYKT